MSSATRRQAETFADAFTNDTAPKFAAEAKAALAHDWSKLDAAALVSLFRVWTDLALVDFARHSLKPTVFAELAWTTLAGLLQPALGEERAGAAVAEVALGARSPAEADFAGAVRRFAAGELERAAFVEQFGHRARNEMELAQPRWREDEQALDALKKAHGRSSVGFETSSPPQQLTDLKLTGPAALWADRLRTYLGLREAAKHYLLLGYAVIRRTLVELDRRFALNGGIFYLLPTEFNELLAGKDVTERIAARKKRRQRELTLEVPAVLFSDDLEAIGRPTPLPESATQLAGVPLSAGSAEAPALVLSDPRAAPPGDEPYILVCPSTDPAWVPLFAKAKGLVMETGGVLSHGAIVAREFGLPAVAGLPGATRQLRTGQRLRVDGARGTVAVLGD
jgi:pyruvate,water dikinase